MVRDLRNVVLFIMIIASFSFAQTSGEKCGTFSVVQQLTISQKYGLELPLVTRPLLQTSRVTPNGKIRIHYDTSGINQPAMVSVTTVNGIKTVTRIPGSHQRYIDTLLSLFDSVWRAEIDHFGFTAPPADGGRGGGDEFDVYVEELGGGLFGETMIETDLPVGPQKANQQYATYIRFENDFGSGYRTNGVEAMMATSAHEFHHAVQVGGSGVWESDYFYYYELSAEAMEHVVFSHAKDYLFDLRTYFKNIGTTGLFQQRSSFETAGYERAIWGIYLMKKYGTDIMKRIWEEIALQRPAPAVNNALHGFSTSLEREFADFSYWNFFTAHRADSSRYYRDAALYPAVTLTRTISVGSAAVTEPVSMRSFTANYFKAQSASDSAFFIIANTDVPDAVNNTQQTFSAQLQISPFPVNGFDQASNSLYAKFNGLNSTNWSYIPLMLTAKPYCFPNPFDPMVSSLFISPKGISVTPDLTLTIIALPTMDKVYQDRVMMRSFSGIQYVEWKGNDDEGRKVPSGIYVYILSNSVASTKGKFAVIR